MVNTVGSADPFATSASTRAVWATALGAMALVLVGLGSATIVPAAIWFAVGAGAGYSLSGSV